VAGERKGGVPRGVSILMGGGHFLADRVGPPSDPPRELARSSAARHRLRDLRVVPSGLNQPQFPVFWRKT